MLLVADAFYMRHFLLLLLGASATFAQPGDIEGLRPKVTVMNVITVNPGRAKDSTGAVDIVVNFPTQVVFSDQVGLNCRDKGLMAAGSWYLYAIAGASASGFLFSQSQTSPALPPGISWYRRLPTMVVNQLNGFPMISPPVDAP